MEFRTKREAEEAIREREQEARLCARAARRAAKHPDLAAEKTRAGEMAAAEAARLRALLPTLEG
jgi:hypothetical protein